MIRKVLLFALIAYLPLVSSGQTQQGYVRTKGRLGTNGAVINGTRLSGAIITVKGGNKVESGDNGAFSMSIPTNNYYLQNVQKKGYVLTDPEILSKQYVQSKNPLVLLLETKEQQADDKLAAERRIRRTLQRQLQDKEAVIESLREQQKINEAEYRKQLQEIYAQQESNERLISQMANRYSQMDFEQMDDFNCHVSQMILEGKLTEADSLLNTKGDINTRAAVLRQHQKANDQAEQKIKKDQEQLEKSKELTRKELEDLALDCYSKFEIFKMQHQNDSAAYYLELRAEMDPLNMGWRFSLYNYMQEYMGDTHGALDGYEKCRILLENQTNIDSVYLARCYDAIGTLYHQTNEKDYSHSLLYLEKALSIRRQLYGNEHEEIAISYSNIGTLFNKIDSIDKSLESYKKALSIRKKIYDKDTIQHSIATLYINMASLYRKNREPDKALDCYKHVLDIKHALLPGNYHRSIARCHNGIAVAYIDKKDYTTSLHHLQKALEISDSVYGRRHELTAKILFSMGDSYIANKAFSEAIKAFSQALDVFTALEKINNYNKQYNINQTKCCIGLGESYYKMGDYLRAKEFYRKAKDFDYKKQYTDRINKKLQIIQNK